MFLLIQHAKYLVNIFLDFSTFEVTSASKFEAFHINKHTKKKPYAKRYIIESGRRQRTQRMMRTQTLTPRSPTDSDNKR